MLWSVSAIGLLVLLASVAKKRFQHNADACTRRPNDDSPCSLIVVLGCPPAAISGSVNRYFLGRIHATLQLAAEIPSARVLCTGGVDEAALLRASLIRQGIDAGRIEIDSTSARTIDSIDFLARSAPQRSICFVSQPFHLPRVIYLAEQRGLEASAWPALGPKIGWRLRIREPLATLRAIFEVNVSRR
jgi:SanA protein